MDILEAIESISSRNTLTGFAAKAALKDKSRLTEFVEMIKHQYENDGNNDRLVDVYGEEVITTIINYKNE